MSVVDIGVAKAKPKRAPRAPTGDWRDALLYADGKIAKCVTNAITILAHDDAWRDVLAFDAFGQSVTSSKTPPWSADDAPERCEPGEWTDVDTVRLQSWLHRVWALKLPKEAVFDAVRVVADRRVVHPVRDWLDGLEWDCTRRVDTWTSVYLGAAADRYTSLVGRWTLVAAVARVYDPGCKCDSMLVLEGPQGGRKSTAIRTTFGAQWFSDTPLDLESKDRFVSIRSRWCIELAELDSLKRSGVDRIKSFLSSPTDSYRPPYGRTAVAVPRSCIFVGSVNGSSYLTDETGNRRFWPLTCGAIDIDGLARDRAQLWAEAREIYRSDPRWWPLGDELRECQSEQAARLAPDAWSEKIDAYLARLFPDVEVSVGDILAGPLSIEPGRWTQSDQTRVARCLVRAGWVRVQRRLDGGRRRWVYVRGDTSVTGDESQVVAGPVTP